jgi:glycosyltransferase involved in cell wall biosynthesis
LNILLSNSTDIFAGGEDYVLILAKQLQRRGHAVSVSAQPGHLLLQKCEAAGIPVLPIRYSGMSRVFAVGVELRQAMERVRAHVVHSNANYDRTAAALAAAFSGVAHVASVHSAHSIRHNITHYLRNRFGIDHFIADAEQVRSVLVEDGIDTRRISVVPIGVEEADRASFFHWRNLMREQLGVADDICVVGNVARLVPFKGHRYLLEAAAKVVKTRRNVLFVVVGDGELMNSLVDMTRHLELENHVRFLGFRDNLHEIYPAFDIYCHASLELEAEAFPLAILRALSTGLPVVATNVGGIGLMVKENITGILTLPENATELAEALLRIIQQPAERIAMAGKSRELFTSEFHASIMAERVEQVYERVLRS